MSSENPTTRVKILNAAWRLLEEGDGQEVRMGDIAKAAGISRQALYGHFPARAELLIATARHLDEAKDVDARLAASRAATGVARLDAYVEAWGGYIPEIYGIGRAFMAMMDTDDAAAAAWRDRMQAVRHGCEAAVCAVYKDGRLRADLTIESATDLLWMILSVRNWEQLRHECDWSQDAYVDAIKDLARRALLSSP